MKVCSFVTLVIVLITITSCSSSRSGVNDGSYSINKSQGKPGTLNPVVYGYLFEHGTKFPSTVPRVYVGKDLKSIANPKSGQYSFSITPGKYRFTGIGLSYYPTKTKRIKVSKGDSLNIDFYLKINDTPLVD